MMLPVRKKPAGRYDNAACCLPHSISKWCDVDKVRSVADNLANGCIGNANNLNITAVGRRTRHIARNPWKLGIKLQHCDPWHHQIYCLMFSGNHVASAGNITRITIIKSIKPTIGIAVFEM